MEMEPLTDLVRTKMKQRMQDDEGASWWNNKLRPRCLKCRALPDGATLGDTRKEHMEKTTAKDIARANKWNKTVETNKNNWELTDIQNYKDFTEDSSIAPDDEIAERRPIS